MKPHVPGVWIPPKGTINELDRPAEELVDAIVPSRRA